MKINTITELDKLNRILREYFGEVPTNIIIESPEIINQAKEQMGVKTSIQNLAVLGIKVYGEAIELVND